MFASLSRGFAAGTTRRIYFACSVILTFLGVFCFSFLFFSQILQPPRRYLMVLTASSTSTKKSLLIRQPSIIFACTRAAFVTYYAVPRLSTLTRAREQIVTSAPAVFFFIHFSPSSTTLAWDSGLRAHWGRGAVQYLP